MANYVSAMRARQRLGLESGTPLPAITPGPRNPAPAFLRESIEAEWQRQQSIREAMDALTAHTKRWAVTVIPADSAARHFYMRGTLAEVTRRARHIFESSYIATIEPAGDVGGERYDSRLNT